MITITHKSDLRSESAPDIGAAIKLLSAAYGDQIEHGGDWIVVMGLEHLAVYKPVRRGPLAEWHHDLVAMISRPIPA